MVTCRRIAWTILILSGVAVLLCSLALVALIVVKLYAYFAGGR